MQDQHTHEDIPPRSLLLLGYSGLMILVVGQHLGGTWGEALARAGAAAITAGALVFLLRFLVWRAEQERR
jgi:hypothetical protein